MRRGDAHDEVDCGGRGGVQFGGGKKKWRGGQQKCGCIVKRWYLHCARKEKGEMVCGGKRSCTYLFRGRGGGMKGKDC